MTSPHKNINVVIIDDEYLNRELVALMIQSYKPSFTIVGKGSSVREGYEVILSVRPDVVFVDIKMPDGSGFDLLKKIGTIDFEVVFVSGFDTYALRAFEFNAIDYVLKPIDPDKFRDTLERIERRVNSGVARPYRQILESYGPTETMITKIPIQNNGDVQLVDLREVIYLKSYENSTLIVKDPAQTFTTDRLLSDFEFILEKFINYIRIGDDLFVNLNYIISYSRDRAELTLSNGEIIKISGPIKNEIVNSLDKSIPGKASL